MIQQTNMYFDFGWICSGEKELLISLGLVEESELMQRKHMNGRVEWELIIKVKKVCITLPMLFSLAKLFDVQVCKRCVILT